MYFTKLNQPFNILPENFEKKDLVVSYNNNINFFNINLGIDLFEILPERYRNSFHSSVMEVQNNLNPHTDNGIKCSINFYINPSNYRTRFFDIKHDIPSDYVGVGSEKVFLLRALTEVGSFVAIAGDAWLLDVTRPHSVRYEGIGLPERRLAIAIQTSKFSYEDTIEMLKETGYLN
jgi:hypothetical protein